MGLRLRQAELLVRFGGNTPVGYYATPYAFPVLDNVILPRIDLTGIHCSIPRLAYLNNSCLKHLSPCLCWFILDSDFGSARHPDGHISRIIRDDRLAPAKDPFRIVGAGVDATSRRWFAIVVMPIRGMNCDSCTDKQTDPSNRGQTPARRSTASA